MEAIVIKKELVSSKILEKLSEEIVKSNSNQEKNAFNSDLSWSDYSDTDTYTDYYDTTTF